MREQGRRAVGDELPGALIWFVGIVGRIEWERRRDPEDARTSDEGAAARPHLRADRRHGGGAARRAAARRRAAAVAVGGQPQPPGAARGLALARDRQGRRRDAPVQPLLPHAHAGRCSTPASTPPTPPSPAARTTRRWPSATVRAPRRTRASRRPTTSRAARAARRGGHEAETIRRRVGQRDQRAPAQRPRRSTGTCCCRARGPQRPATSPPAHEHGTHVAGMLAGDWRQDRPAAARRPRHPGRLPGHGALRPARVRRRRRRRRVRDPRRAAVRALAQLQRLRAGHPRRQPLALARPRGRRLRVRAHAGVRRVRAAARQRHRRRRRGRQRGPRLLLDGVRHRRGLPPDLDHRPRQRRRRDHRRRHPSPPAPHLRRLLLLEPRPDRRRARSSPTSSRPARRSPRRCRTSGSRASTARAWPRRTCPAPRRC